MLVLQHWGAPLPFSRVCLLALERIRARRAPTPAQLYPEPCWGLTKRDKHSAHKGHTKPRKAPRAGPASSASTGLGASFWWLLRRLARPSLRAELTVSPMSRLLTLWFLRASSSREAVGFPLHVYSSAKSSQHPVLGAFHARETEALFGTL